MSERKPVTINYYRMEAAEEVFYHGLADKLTSLEEGGMDYGTFDGRSQELTFKIHEGIELSDRRLFIVSLIKEKKFYPVRFDNEGNVMEPEPALGDIAYALIDPFKQCLVTFGNMASGFADFMRWLTDDQSAGVSPIFKQNAYDTVTQWEVYRSVEIKAEAPAMDFVHAILDSEHGDMFKGLDMLKGLSADIKISMGRSKGSLDKKLVRDFIRVVLKDNFAGKLKITGKNFDEQSTETIDLYAAKVQHKTEIVVAGTHVSPDEARNALFEAYQINLDHIEIAVADFEGNE